jgi:hypothetical protein
MTLYAGSQIPPPPAKLSETVAHAFQPFRIELGNAVCIRHGICSSLGPRGFGSKSGDLVNRTAKKRNRESTPFVFYILAEKLFAVGKKDEAVFWYYAGQLRYRVYLLVNKDKLEPSGDPAAFAALSEEIGRPINEYAFGDIPQLAKTIDAVLAWDESHSNALTPHKKYRSQYDQIVAGHFPQFPRCVSGSFLNAPEALRLAIFDHRLSLAKKRRTIARSLTCRSGQ